MKTFNIIISGVGGQGLITLLKILSEAALSQGYEIRTSELHGLSQRGGSVEVHIRFGKKVYSPLISRGKADLVLGLEMIEGLRAIKYASNKTVFLINKNTLAFEGSLPEKQVIVLAEKEIKGKKYLIPASEICQKELGNEVVSGVYLLGLGIAEKIIPLKKESVLKAIKELVPSKFFELNKKAFLMPFKKK